MRRKSWWVVMVFVLAIGLVTTGCGGDTDKAAEDDQAVLVAVAEAEKGLLSRGDILTGKVIAKAEVNLVPKMPGKVSAVLADVGDRVQAGQTLMRLDATELQAQLSQAEAGVTLAESGLRQAELSFRDTQKNYERMKHLYEQGAIAAAEFEKVEMGYEIARDQAEKLAPAQLKQAKAQLAYVQANYNNTILTSPISGIVSARSVTVGELAAQTMPVFTVVSFDSVYVETNASEQQVNKIKAGQEVTVRISAVSSEPLAGKVTNVSPAADSRTRTYPVKVEMDNPEHLIKPGMFAEVDLSKTDDEVIIVPRDAIVHRSGASAVFVLTDDEDSVQFRQVVTGGSDGKNIAILEGLQQGEKVVISGQESLESGTKVKVTRFGGQ
ncbi:MAG: efflux RND transporter periplasmic adaptor subunit [Clostridia bacterium]|nr:efflux RND transporter periplasmic adaptor subunit [Clostridia bacterium]